MKNTSGKGQKYDSDYFCRVYFQSSSSATIFLFSHACLNGSADFLHLCKYFQDVWLYYRKEVACGGRCFYPSWNLKRLCSSLSHFDIQKNGIKDTVHLQHFWSSLPIAPMCGQVARV